jgi:hypothetical protein
VLKKRSRDLETGIARMLSDDAGPDSPVSGQFARAIVGHPLITALGRKRGRRPSYISSDLFSAALIDQLLEQAEKAGEVAENIKGKIEHIEKGIEAAPLPNGARRRLEAIRRQAGQDIDGFRRAVEIWFDHQMDRVSGWYTRWAQIVMLIVGVVAALLLNVSAVTVARVLWNDPVLRTELVTEAEQAGDEATDASTEDGEPTTAVGTEVELSRFPIGWNDTAWPGQSWYLVLHLLGIIAVGLAASFGAPFWFDLLSKVSNLRTTGPKPNPANPT